MSAKFQKVKGFYDIGAWNDLQVRNAVGKGWITAEEYEKITGKSYD